jgi:menaquinone-dependent protoporphyrinogen IX oxidase
MKGLVVYDSYYGNTQRVAEAIAAELKSQGQEVELRSVRKKYPTPPQGDFLFIGSPVRMGKTTKRVKKYLEALDKHAWSNKPLVVFTTVLALPADPPPARVESREKYDLMAGRKLAEFAKAQGLNVLDDRLAVDVGGLKGPLIDTGLDQAREFTRGILGRL